MKRQPYRAGSFYQANRGACLREARELIESVDLPKDLPPRLFGGIVPHAGWMFSGKTAAATLKALHSRGRLNRVVIFGADHWGIGSSGVVYDEGAWITPLGEVGIDEELAEELLENCPQLRADPDAHQREHSIEVQLPIMQVLNEDVRIVPIIMPPTPEAVRVGKQIGEVLKRDFPDVTVIGSTDLTHYGPQYGFMPGGGGLSGLELAKNNDRRMLDVIERMDADGVIREASTHQNACGAGAVAATVSACKAMGATRAITLQYTTSADVIAQLYGSRDENAVGYAAIVFA